MLRKDLIRQSSIAVASNDEEDDETPAKQQRRRTKVGAVGGRVAQAEVKVARPPSEAKALAAAMEAAEALEKKAAAKEKAEAKVKEGPPKKATRAASTRSVPVVVDDEFVPRRAPVAAANTTVDMD